MLREYVKWDYELRMPVQVEAVVDRAVELMHAEPRGPVYLTLPREVLAAKPGRLTITSPPRRASRADTIPRFHSRWKEHDECHLQFGPDEPQPSSSSCCC